jgi:hypothetical protein
MLVLVPPVRPSAVHPLHADQARRSSEAQAGSYSSSLKTPNRWTDRWTHACALSAGVDKGSEPAGCVSVSSSSSEDAPVAVG